MFLIGKSSLNEGFSIATFDHRRVSSNFWEMGPILQIVIKSGSSRYFKQLKL